jgi:hypothetical protein
MEGTADQDAVSRVRKQVASACRLHRLLSGIRFRKKKHAKSLVKAAAASRSIDSYFRLATVPASAPETAPGSTSADGIGPEVDREADQSEEEASDDDLDENELVTHGKMIAEIDAYLANKKGKESISAEERAKLQAIQQYLRIRQTGIGKGQACLQVAIVNGKTPYWGRCILCWASQWKTNKKIVLSRRGKHPKTKNLLADSDVYLLINSWLREHHKFDVTPAMLQKHVSEVVLPAVGITNEKNRISERTATRWLRALGWTRSEVKKGIYVDGHERADVVAYRAQFLQQMQEYERRMIKAKDADPTTLDLPNLRDGERALVFYTHDESIFYSNDGQRIIWHPDGEMPLRKKGQGRSIMVSEFLSEVDGQLSHTCADGSKLEAREIIHPGKNHNGYWTGKDVAKQFRKAIAIHKKSSPSMMHCGHSTTLQITTALPRMPCS